MNTYYGKGDTRYNPSYNNASSYGNTFRKRFDKRQSYENKFHNHHSQQRQFYRPNRNTRMYVAPLIDDDCIIVKFPGENREIRTLVDTGADTTLISQSLVRSSGYLSQLPHLPLPRGLLGAAMADGSFLPYLYSLKVTVIISGKHVTQRIIVCNKLSSPLVLATDFLAQHKAVISYLNETMYFNLDPTMLAHSDYSISPHHTGIVSVKLPTYIKKDTLLCLQPSIPGLHVTDSLTQTTATGRYQTARIIVKNESSATKYIKRNQPIGFIDFVHHNQLFQDPIQQIVHSITMQEPDKATKGKFKPSSTQQADFTHQGSEGSIRSITFFEDKSIDISKFEQITKNYGFNNLIPTENLDQQTLGKLKYVILKNLKAFYFPESRIQKVNDYTLKLDLQPDNREPWKQSFYPIPKGQKENVDRQIEVMKKQGIITPIAKTPADVRNSPYSSPCMILKKPGSNTEFRLVSDLRELNKKLTPFPPQDTMSVEQSLIQIANMPLNSISQLDVSHAYFQIGLARESWKFSIVSIGSEKFLIDRMIMGACSSAAVWTFYMIKLLSDLYFHSVISYLDDLYLASDTPDKHLRLLNEIFARSIKVGIQFKASKSLFFQDKITYLGQTIYKDRSIRPKQSTVDALLHIPLPKTLRQLRKFLGMINFFKTYIPDLATIANPLYKLLHGRGKLGAIQLLQPHRDAIQKLKNIMANKPVLYLANFKKDFHLVTHANKTAVSGTLFQIYEEHDKTYTRIIAHSSKTLNPTQVRYDPFLLEVLAIVASLSTFQQSINTSLTNIVTNNEAIKWVLQPNAQLSKTNDSRLKKWMVIIKTFQVRLFFTRHLKPGDQIIDQETAKITKVVPLEILRKRNYNCINTITPECVGKLYSNRYENNDTFQTVLNTDDARQGPRTSYQNDHYAPCACDNKLNRTITLSPFQTDITFRKIQSSSNVIQPETNHAETPESQSTGSFFTEWLLNNPAPCPPDIVRTAQNRNSPATTDYIPEDEYANTLHPLIRNGTFALLAMPSSCDTDYNLLDALDALEASDEDDE